MKQINENYTKNLLGKKTEIMVIIALFKRNVNFRNKTKSLTFSF